jgi:hypothetical protein
MRESRHCGQPGQAAQEAKACSSRGFSIMSLPLRLVAAATLAASVCGVAAAAPAQPALRYAADGKMEFPKDYRTWIYLSTGMDMSYVDVPGVGDRHLFDSVFVNREAYDSFLKTGTWPDKTVMVLEVRMGAGKGSINKKGQFQTDRVGLEVHVKDTARFKKDGWAFFGFGGGEGPGTALPETSACNTCHEQHGSVDTTFVQFYPTLISTAQKMKTMSAAYLAEEEAKATEKVGK